MSEVDRFARPLLRRHWFAPNLTENIETGLGALSVEGVATYLKTGTFKGETTTIGPMAEVVRSSLPHLTDADLRAMAEYLKSIPPDSTLRTGRHPPAAQQARGANLYIDHCMGCHQSRGRGMPGCSRPLAGNGHAGRVRSGGHLQSHSL
jgi:mono/diheme cytochrome c family protein